MPSASFAGQFESFLGIYGEVQLLDSIKACWGSYFRATAITYRNEIGIASDTIEMSVLVQRMVNARVSGIMCTIEPIARDSKLVIINSSWGLGNSIVHGEVTPDSFIVDKESERPDI